MFGWFLQKVKAKYLILAFLLSVIGIVVTKLFGVHLFPNSIESNTSTLNYVILKPRTPINMKLIESEKYESAIVVQQLIGTLTYFSNKGRYEPRLAQSWTFDENRTWTFRLRPGLKCENGEPITPQSFKRSLERSLFIYSKIGGVPILNFLDGYDEFLLANKDIEKIDDIYPIQGIAANETDLVFTFQKKIRSGLLQILSFSPLGYLCNGNFDSFGSWSDPEKLISSGPYRLASIDIGKQYVIERNPFWYEFAENSPHRVVITHEIPEHKDPLIVDAFTNEIKIEKLNNFKLVPEYFNSVLLGNFGEGIFRDKDVRKQFAKEFSRIRDSTLPPSFGIHTRANSFYPSQGDVIGDPANGDELKDGEKVRSFLQGKKVIIEGEIPPENNFRWSSWKVLEQTLRSFGMTYEFSNNPADFENTTSFKYDVRIRGSSIGGGVEPWGLFVIFCSSMGIRYPDPSATICPMVENYENGELSLEQLVNQFLGTVGQEYAILPVSHYGVQLFVSDHIDTDSLSPLMSTIRFDQLRLMND